MDDCVNDDGKKACQLHSPVRGCLSCRRVLEICVEAKRCQRWLTKSYAVDSQICMPEPQSVHLDDVKPPGRCHWSQVAKESGQDSGDSYTKNRSGLREVWEANMSLRTPRVDEPDGHWDECSREISASGGDAPRTKSSGNYLQVYEDREGRHSGRLLLTRQSSSRLLLVWRRWFSRHM
jgi:hypothetical protein